AARGDGRDRPRMGRTPTPPWTSAIPTWAGERSSTTTAWRWSDSSRPRSGALVALTLAAQEVLHVLHQLVRVDLPAGERRLFLARRRVVFLLELPHVLSRGAIARHRLVAFGPELLNGLGQARGVQAQVQTPGNVSHERFHGSGVLSVLTGVRSLAHEAQMRHAPTLRRVQDDRGDARGAFVGWRAKDAPGFEERSPHGIGTAPRDGHGTRVGRAREERAQRDDP